MGIQEECHSIREPFKGRRKERRGLGFGFTVLISGSGKERPVCLNSSPIGLETVPHFRIPESEQISPLGGRPFISGH